MRSLRKTPQVETKYRDKLKYLKSNVQESLFNEDEEDTLERE